MTNLPKLLLIALGGTISMVRDASGAIAPALRGDDLVRAVPGIDKIAQVEVVSPMTRPGASLASDRGSRSKKRPVDTSRSVKTSRVWKMKSCI